MSVFNIAKKQERIYFIKVVIFFTLLFGFGYLPAVAPLTQLGMKVLGIFLGLLFAWTTIGLLWPSIVGLMVLVAVQAMDIKTALASGWGSSALLLIFFMTVIAACVEQSGLSHRIAVWFISCRITRGRPWLFIAAFLFSTFIISAVTSTIPAIMICWSILYSICEEVGYKPHDPFPSFMIVGIVAAAAFGLALFPFKTIGITIFGVLENMTGLTADYLTYVCFTFPMGILCIVVYILFGKMFFKLDVSLLKNRPERAFGDMDAELTEHQKMIAGFVGLLILLLIAPGMLPEEFFLTEILDRIQAVGTTFLIVAIMCCIKTEGEPILDFPKVVSQGMQWNVIFLVSVVMPLSRVLTSEETGITDFMMRALSPLLAGHSPTVFLLIIVLTAIAVTSIILQSIGGAILLTVFYPFAISLGINPLMLTSLLVFTCHFGILIPSASPMAALLHGNSEWISAKEIYLYGISSVLASGLTVCIFGIPYIQFVFG